MSRSIKQLILLFILLVSLDQSIAQNPADTTGPASTVKQLPDSIRKLPAEVKGISRQVSTLEKAVAGDPCKDCGVKCSGNMKSTWKWILVFLPMLLFFVLGSVFVSLILKGRFDLAETLSTGGTSISTTNSFAKGVDAVPSTETIAVEKKPVGSTSRLIAFLSGLTALLVAICLLTYYAYFTIAECSGELKFKDLWEIIAGLGIGIIPYGVNVWRGNKKEEAPAPPNR